MSTIQTMPKLESGMRLTREEFLNRWDALPNVKYAELLDGVVYMPSPVSNHHGTPNGLISTWIGLYRWQTPGTEMGMDLTYLMTNNSVPQPDVSLWIMPEHGGTTGDDKGLMTGVLELAIEVSYSSLSQDLGKKLKLYENAGVQEYIVVGVAKQEIHWHRLIDGEFQRIEPNEDGLLQSVVFPGLWLDEEAFFNKDTTQLQTVLQAGLQSPEHVEFIERLQLAKKE